ncbi:hypothetical protein EYF80_022800 [Liparis tanakae]|uniref:Uncharacterized protein n=1 Tax=Liparis tanakae TaxID=230148 RepID=A0A4Z2HMP7_9TELE|nr:hypothetical protein EYF80_022800 [Liparis tanakae]
MHAPPVAPEDTSGKNLGKKGGSRGGRKGNWKEDTAADTANPMSPRGETQYGKPTNEPSSSPASLSGGQESNRRAEPPHPKWAGLQGYNHTSSLIPPLREGLGGGWQGRSGAAEEEGFLSTDECLAPRLFQNLPSSLKISQVSCGERHTLFGLEDGSVAASFYLIFMA